MWFKSSKTNGFPKWITVFKAPDILRALTKPVSLWVILSLPAYAGASAKFTKITSSCLTEALRIVSLFVADGNCGIGRTDELGNNSSIFCAKSAGLYQSFEKVSTVNFPSLFNSCSAFTVRINRCFLSVGIDADIPSSVFDYIASVEI